jgi:hypothetical protein
VGDAGHAFLSLAAHGLGRMAILAGSDGAPWCADLVQESWFPQLAGQVAAWLLAPGEAAGEEGVVIREEDRILAGDGLTDQELASLARRLGGILEERSLSPLPPRLVVEPGEPVPWLLALALAFLSLLALERWGRRSGGSQLSGAASPPE